MSMKKKKGKEYSLTAKERKQLRKSSDAKEPKDPVLAEPTEQIDGDAVAVPARKPLTRKNVWILCVSIALGLIIILTAIILPFVINDQSSKYPRAVITLDDGRTITATIWEEECPIAATNFIFLAQIGFFDGVLIHDVQPDRNYMRFGAVKSYAEGDNRFNDAGFIASIPKSKFNIVNLEKASDRVAAESKKFGYQLQKDTSDDKSRYGERYVLSFNYSSSADFVINLVDGNTNFTNQNGQSNIAGNLVAFAKIEDEESQKVLDTIYGYTKDPNTGTNSTYVGTDPQVRIRSVKVSNLSKKKWKNFEFVSYMNTAYNGRTAFRNWVG